jgi:hypothetical protein
MNDENRVARDFAIAIRNLFAGVQAALGSLGATLASPEINKALAEAKETIATAEAYESSADEDARALAAFLWGLPFREAGLVARWLRPPPKPAKVPGKRGPKGPRPKLVALERAVMANLLKSSGGAPVSMRRVAAELTKVRGLPAAKIEDERRRLQEHKKAGVI